MNTNTGQIYPDWASALANIGPTETAADVVEIRGDFAAVQSLSRAVQQARAAELRHAANKRARAARRQGRS